MRHLFNIEFANFSHEFNASDLDPGGYPDDITCDSFFSYLKILHTYYLPTIIAVGFVGNFLSCAVFLSTHLKMRSSSYYLAALAVADLGFLCVVLVVQCSFNNISDIFNTEGWCQFFVYVSSVCACLSVWLIVAFTVERFIAVQYPLQRPHICTVSRAKTIVIILTIVAFVSQLYYFWIAGLINVHDRPECEMRPDYLEFMKVVNFLDTLATLIVPFVLIVTMNTMIARNLLLFKRRMQAGSLDEYLYSDKDKTELQRSHTQSGSLNQRQGSQQSQNSQKSNPSRLSKKTTSISNQLERCPCIHVKMSSRSAISNRNQHNITKMLLLISSVFIALNSPSYVIRLWVYFVFTLQQKAPPETLYCLQQFAMLLFYTNFSINFLLYAMCGVTFRRCLWQLVRNNLKRLANRPFSKAVHKRLTKVEGPSKM